MLHPIHELTYTILLVDDDPDHLALCARWLEGSGYPVDTAASGAEALACLERENFDMVLMDCQMPVMDGITAAEKIGKKIAAPIVLLTGSTEPETIERARDAGVSNYSLKPFNADQLRVAVELAIHRFIEISNLKEENAKLKKLLAEEILINDALKDVVEKKW